MHSGGYQTITSPARTPQEWHELGYLRPARRTYLSAAASILTVAIAILDISISGNHSPLFVIPLLMFYWAGALLPLWRSVGPMIAFTYLDLLIKTFIHVQQPGAWFFDLRLLNRTFVAVMIFVLGKSLLVWSRWREDQSDRELPEYFRKQEQEVGATFAMLCCAPLFTLIAVFDLLSPANINCSILYPIPLFICAWTGSRRLLWSVLGLLLVLMVAALYLGPPSTVEVTTRFGLERSRLVVAAGLIALTLFLNYTLSRSRQAPDATGD